MLYGLRRKIIIIATISVAVAMLFIFVATYVICTYQLNSSMDLLVDGIPVRKVINPSTVLDNDDKPDYDIEDMPGFLSEETPYSTRFFIVYTDKKEIVKNVNLESIASVDEKLAKTYTEEVFDAEEERGWEDSFRYKVTDTNVGSAIVFVDGSMNRSFFYRILITMAVVLLFSGSIIIGIIVLFSRRIVKPVAESYEKQRQFVTDANHELKTPLSLILANTDIAEQEFGKNEWIDDIRSEGKRMTLLVNQLVVLSKMDEDSMKLECDEFSLSDAVLDTLSEFSGHAELSGKQIVSDIEESVSCSGDEALIRRLIAILLDNAVKYCDEHGLIEVSLVKKYNTILTVENTYAEVENLEFERLFDRFYRYDKVRTFSGSFGIGLSIAKSIVEKHGGEITAYKKSNDVIGFKVVLKK